LLNSGCSVTNTVGRNCSGNGGGDCDTVAAKDTKNAVGSCNSPDFRQESGGKTDGTSLFHPVDDICPWEVSQNAKLQENRGFLYVMVVLFLTR